MSGLIYGCIAPHGGPIVAEVAGENLEKYQALRNAKDDSLSTAVTLWTTNRPPSISTFLRSHPRQRLPPQTPRPQTRPTLHQ